MTAIVQQIIQELNQIQTMEDMRSLTEAFRARWQDIQATEANKFLDGIHPGVKVSFQGKGAQVQGVVTKINKKSVQVLVDGVVWRVAPTLLTVLP